MDNQDSVQFYSINSVDSLEIIQLINETGGKILTNTQIEIATDVPILPVGILQQNRMYNWVWNNATSTVDGEYQEENISDVVWNKKQTIALQKYYTLTYGDGSVFNQKQGIFQVLLQSPYQHDGDIMLGLIQDLRHQ